PSSDFRSSPPSPPSARHSTSRWRRCGWSTSSPPTRQLRRPCANWGGPAVQNSTADFRDYDAHVYHDPATTRAVPAELRETIGRGFAVRLGRWHDALIGPHTASMYQVAFANDQCATLVPFLMLNRSGLSVLVHPNTGAPRDDHLVHALWLGEQL